MENKDRLKTKMIGQIELNVIFEVLHELRIPMSSIKEYAFILAQGDLGPVNKEQTERLVKINNLCDYLNSLIKDSLHVLEITSEAIEREREQLSLTEIIEQSVDEIRFQVEQKQIKIQLNFTSELPRFWGERENLKEVVVNLLNNAIKFTHPQGTITIESFCRPDGFIQVNISDTGEGIDQEQLQNVFEPFFSHNKDDRTARGLGLSVVKQIIELHHGKVWAKSKLGEGSKFSFSLPVGLRVGR